MIILARLFFLQIIGGSDYRETSNTRLSRESKIEATRGDFLDRNGTVLVSSEMTFSLEMYKSKAEDADLNSSISLMTDILQRNGNEYVDNFPISIEPFEFHFSSDEELSKWKEKYKIPQEASAEEAFYLFRDKYGIKSDDIAEIRRILAIRYEITTKGYSATRSIEISKSISRECAIQLDENKLDLTGVNIITESNRIYYMGNLASHILGYMGRISQDDLKELESEGDEYEYEPDDKIGQTGAEKVFEKYLRGADGVKQIDMDVNGVVTGEYVTQEAIGGADIVLTIDANLQRVTEEALANCINGIKTGAYSQVYDAKGGAAVVVDVNTGEILAMASNPDFSPALHYNGLSTAQYNDYRDRKVWLNKAIQGAYQPGSTFKMVTAIAGLETGKITPTERINDVGVYTEDNDNAHCWYYDSYKHGHGLLNVMGAIQKSCNYYFYVAGRRIGIDELDRYARYFGLGSKTGIELTGESAGTLASKEAKPKLHPDLPTWLPSDTIRAAIGQSDNSFTPVQMAKYIAMVANGGHKIDLTIIKNIMLSSGGSVSREEINEYVNRELNLSEDNSEDLQINPETINVVKEGMRSVTEDGGTASQTFRDLNVTVGGKTGSAETGSGENANVNAWFVGFAPYENPQIAVAVVIENGGHGFYAGDVVKAVMQEYFGTNTQNITEDMSVESEMESFN